MMSKNTSSIHFTSNVFPVNVSDGRINFNENDEYIEKITDRSALKKLFRLQYGGTIDERDYLQSLRSNPIPGIKEWQIKRFETPDECALAEKGEKPWGLIIKDGKYFEICKCLKKDCREFKICRSDLEIKNAIDK